VFCHVPVASQVCGRSPLHCFVVGEQTPVQAPALQTFAQAVPLFCQVPVASQVCGCSPLHCFIPGVQAPEQAPPLQR